MITSKSNECFSIIVYSYQEVVSQEGGVRFFLKLEAAEPWPYQGPWEVLVSTGHMLAAQIKHQPDLVISLGGRGFLINQIHVCKFISGP